MAQEHAVGEFTGAWREIADAVLNEKRDREGGGALPRSGCSRAGALECLARRQQESGIVAALGILTAIEIQMLAGPTRTRQRDAFEERPKVRGIGRSSAADGEPNAMYDARTRQLSQSVEPERIHDIVSGGTLPPERLRLDLDDVDQPGLTTNERLQTGCIDEADAERRRGERGSRPHDSISRAFLTSRLHEARAIRR